MLTDISWNNPAGGAWEVAENWMPAEVPGSDDNVMITLDGTYAVTVTGSKTVIGLVVGGATGTQTLQNTSGTFRVTAASTIGTSGVIQLDAGTFDDDGGLTVNGTFNWTGGTFSGLAASTISTGATLNISGDLAKTLSSHTLNNDGTIVHGGTGNLTMSGGTLDNRVGGVYEFQGDADITGSTVFSNSGALRKSAGTGESRISARLDNLGGTIDVQTGQITLASSSSVHTGGMFNVNGGAILDLTGGTSPDFGGTYTGSGAGRVELSSGTLTTAGTGATFNMPAGLFHWTGGQTSAAAARPFTNAGFATLSGDLLKSLAGPLNNTGTVVHTGNGNLDGGTVNNQAGALWEVQTDADYGVSLTQVFNNSGTFRKSSGGGETAFGINSSTQFLHFLGTVEVNAGRLSLSRSGNNLVQSTGATFTVATGAVLDLTGGSNTLRYVGTYTGSGGGRIDLAAGTLNTDAPVTFNMAEGLFHWTGGSISGSSTEPFTNAGFMTLSGPADKNNTGHIVNTGTVIHESGRHLFSAAGAGSFFINEAGAVYEVRGNGVSLEFGTFVNRGTLSRTAGDDESLFDIGLDLEGGTIDVQSGRLKFTDGGDWTGGTLMASASGVLELAGALEFTLESAAAVTGSGDGRVELSTAPLVARGEVATWNFTEGLFHWTGGSIGAGTGMPLHNLGFITLAGANAKTLGNKLMNSGTVIQQDTGAVAGDVIENKPGALWDIRGDAGFGSGTFTNEGTLRKSAGAGESVLQAELNNTAGGVIEVQSGSIRQMQGGGDWTGGVIEVSAGAKLVLDDQPGGGSVTWGGVITGSGAGRVELTTSIHGDEDNPPRLDFPEGMFHWVGNELVLSSGHIVNDGFISLIGPQRPGARANITNNGTIIQQGDVTFRLFQTSEINNNGLWDIRGDGSIEIVDFSFVGSVFHNLGTIRKSGGLGTSRLFATNFAATSFLSNVGTVDVQTGTLEIDAKVQQLDATTSTLHGGTWRVGPFATLNIVNASDTTVSVTTNHGHVILDGPGSSFPNINTLATNGGSFDLLGGRDFATAGAFTNGVQRLDTQMTGIFHTPRIRQAGIAVDPTTDNLFIHARNEELVREFTTDGFEVSQFNHPSDVFQFMGMEFTSTALNFAGVDLPAGTLLWSDGDAAPPFILALDKTDGTVWATLNLPALPLGLPGVAHHPGRGTLFVLSSNRSIFEINASDGSVVNSFPAAPVGSPPFSFAFGGIEVNEATGNLYVVGDGQVVVREVTPAGAFVQDFNLRQSGPANHATQATFSDIAIDNATGEIWLLDEAEAVYRFAPLVIGTFGDVTVGPGSTLTVNGNFTENATDTLHIEIAGRPRSGHFGRVNVTEQATLTGRLDIIRTGGYGPTAGDVYQIMSFASRVGGFSSITGLEPFFDATVGASNVTLTARADAPTFDLLAGPITLPASGVPGQDVSISYEVQNATDMPAGGTWTDSVYLSRDPFFSPEDPLIGRVEHTSGVAAMGSYTESLTAPLPGVVDGDYHVIVIADSGAGVPDSDRGNNVAASAGTFAVGLPMLAFGVTTPGTIADSQDLYYRLDVPFGGDVLLTANFTEPLQAEFFVRFDKLPSRSKFDFTASNLLELNRTILLASPQPGPYYLLVHGREGAAGGTPFDLGSQFITFEVRSVTPGRGGNTGVATSRIEGAGFGPDAVVSLRDDAGATVATGSVQFVNANELFVTFELTGVVPARYDLVVSRAAGEVVVDDGFEVVAGEPGRLRTAVQMPPRVRGGRIYDAFIEYFNEGGTDLPAPVVTVTISAGDTLTLSPTAEPNQTTVSFLAIGTDGPAGVLAPGASGRVPLRFKTGGAAGASIETFIGDGTNTTPMDWDALRSTIRPDAPSADWDAAFDAAFVAAGATLGDYVRVLASGATLQQLRTGTATGDLDELHFFIVQDRQQAMRANLIGHVFRRDTAHPLGGVTAAAVQRGTGDAFTAMSFADGLLRFQNLPPGLYDLEFLDVLDPTGLEPVTIISDEVVSGQTWLVSDGGRITGFVQSDAGLPLTDDVVSVVAMHSSGQPFAGQFDSIGRYVLRGLPAGTYRLEFSSSQTQLQAVAGIDVVEDQTTLAPDVTLGSVGTVTGMVRDAVTLAPLAGVLVGTVGTATERSATTEPDGTFTLAGVAVGMQPLSAVLAGYQIGMASANVMAYETTSGVIIELVRGAALEGVVTAGGMPVVNAAVDLFLAGRLVNTIVTDAAGMYRFEALVGGDYTLEVSDGVHAPHSSNVSLIVGTNTQDVELADASSVSGLVTRASDGVPLPGLALAIVDSAGNQTPLVTRDDGFFDAIQLDPGDYTLMVADGSHRRPFTIVDDQSDVVINLSLDTGALRGRVLAADGQPTEFRASVFALRDGQVVAETLTAADGSYVFPLLAAGTYDVLAQSPVDSFPLVTGAVVMTGEITMLPDVLAGAFELVVTLHDVVTGGLVTADAFVVLSRQDAPEAVRAVFTGEVQPDGTVRFETLPAGPYKLQAIAVDRAASQTMLTIAGDATSEVLLDASAALAGQITVPAGESAEGLTISVYDPADPEQLWQAVADAAGDYALPALPPGTYTVLVADLRDAPTQRLALETAAGVVLTAGATTTQNFTLVAATPSISGQIHDGAGTSPAAAIVLATNVDGIEVAVALADVFGNFELLGLTPGDYTLRAFAPGFVVTDEPVTLTMGGPLTGVTIDTAWTASSLSESHELADGPLMFAGSILPQWLTGIVDGARAWFRRVFGEPRDTSPNYGSFGIKPECTAALALARQTFRMQMLKIDAFAAWHERWVGAVDILAADVFDFGRNLLGLAQTLLAGSFQAAEAVASLDAARLEVAAALASSNSPSLISTLTRELDNLSDIAANVRVLLRGEENAALLGDLVSSFNVQVGFEDFLKKIKDIQNWNSVDDYYKLLDDANSFVGGVLAVSDLVQLALDRIAGINFPAVKKFFGPLNLITNILSTAISGINGIRNLKNTIDDLKAKEDLYKEAVRRRDELYRQTLQAIDLCYKKCDDKPKPPPPPCRGAGCPRGSRGSSSGVFSSDPNEKATTGAIDPLSASEEAFIRSGTPIHYTVRFENLASATAPAQEVFVTDTLDSSLDLATFQVGDFGFGDLVVDVPDDRGSFATRLDLRSSLGFFVDYEASLDLETRVASWTFRSIDPATGDLVSDADAGFLPPEDGTGRGQGFVTFTVLPNAGLPSGTAIVNLASIVFDTNAPLETNSVTNVIDDLTPTSSVTALPAVVGQTNFTVNWLGTDAAGPAGSGIAFYDVFVSDNGGPFVPFVLGTTDTSAIFTGVADHTYSFFSVATDNVGHQQPTPAGGQTVTLIDVTAPVLSGIADQTIDVKAPPGVATYMPTATDNRDPSPSVTCTPPSGSLFPLGTTMVTCTATDDVGNSSSAMFTVTVRDTIGPALSDTSPVLEQVGKKKRLTSVLLAFDEALDDTARDDINNYAILLLNKGTKPPKPVALLDAEYDPATNTARLIPEKPLKLNKLHQVVARGTLTDAAGNPIGTDSVTTLGVGTKFSLADADGDKGSLKLVKGGLMEFRFGPGDTASRVQLFDTVAGSSALSGKVKASKTGDGRLTVASITGTTGVHLEKLVRCSPTVTTGCLDIGTVSAMVIDSLLASGEMSRDRFVAEGE